MKKFFCLGLILVSLCGCKKIGNTMHSIADRIGGEPSEATVADTIEPEITVSHKLPAYPRPAERLDPQGSNTYEVTNLIDNNPATAWSFTIPPYMDYEEVIAQLEFDLNAKRIDAIEIRNGYAKSDKAFRNNSRARSITISRRDWEDSRREDIIYSGELADTYAPQRLEVLPTYDNSQPTRTIYIWFGNDYYRGSRYNDFTISEIEFYGIGAE